MKKQLIIGAALVAACGVTALAQRATIELPTAWRIDAPSGPEATIGVMPQGIALSPDGTLLAVVESGVNPPALRVLSASDLSVRTTVPLKNAFGKPVWLDEHHVLVPGAASDAVLNVDVTDGSTSALPVAKGSWPAAVALSPDGKTIASANDFSATVTVGSLATFDSAKTISVGAHPSDLVFSLDGKKLYVASRENSTIDAVDLASGAVSHIPVGSHPSALTLSADGTKLYVAESDDDSVGTVDLAQDKRVADVDVGLHAGRASGYGASPNALIDRNGVLFVSLGAENAIAVISGGKVIERIPTGWYPTGIAIGAENALYVSDGKGEGSRANPQYNPFIHGDSGRGYIAATQYGSIREIPFDRYANGNAAAETAEVIANAMPTWSAPPASQTVIRPSGPIRHVIYIIKENRSYDQILGDEKAGDGDPSLVWFGRANTPNQHAIVERFGILDRAFTNSQVSADGHNWTDEAFANDYVERFWPPGYGGRRGLYDFQSGKAPDAPHNGYLWDDATRAGVSFRDYGEDVDVTNSAGDSATFQQGYMPGLVGHIDPNYSGWDLNLSDEQRYKEWKKEFDNYVAGNDLPSLEIVYFPNDHTGGTKPGFPTPQADVAGNDWAVGSLVDAVSHSKYWKSTAIFSVEDDAQNGPDHVGAQRSTFYVASPYALPGVHHEHYTTASVVHTIEILLGMKPMSIYDQTALPLYGAFGTHANLRPFVAVKPAIDMNARNVKTAYGAKQSAKLDFSDPDETNPAVLNDIIAHAVNNVASLRDQGR